MAHPEQAAAGPVGGAFDGVRAQLIVQHAFQIIRSEDAPLPPPDDYWVVQLLSGVPVGAVVSAIFASPEGVIALNQPLRAG